MQVLKMGADIYRMDISYSMINIISGKLEEKDRGRISRPNIINFHFDFAFKLILAPFRVFMHLKDKSDQIKTLNNVYHHLEPKGKFIFNTFVPDLNYLIQGMDHHIDFEGEYKKGQKLKRIVSSRSDLINQLIQVHFRLEWEEGNTPRWEEWDLSLRFFFRFELEHLIERSLFKDYEILGDYEGNKLNQNSKEYISVCY